MNEARSFLSKLVGMSRVFNMIVCYCFFLFLLFPFFIKAQAIDNGQSSKTTSTNQPTLLVFSGSDWCMPCIRLEKEILQHHRFKKFAEQSIDVIKADFPQRIKQDKATILRNERLAEQYNPKGQFPMIVLIFPKENKHQIIDYTHWSVDLFTQQIKETIKSHTHQTFEKEAHLMGTRFTFTIVDTIASKRAERLLQDCLTEVTRYENMLSEWIDTSEVSQLNDAAGKYPLKVNPELYELIQRSIRLSEITQGAFDITYAALGDLWDFNRTNQIPPEQTRIEQSLSRVGYQKLDLRESGEVYLTVQGMRIGFGGVGKGYAADRIKEKMQSQGIEDGVINASGDLVAWGKPPGKDSWKIGIADPKNRERIICWIPINNSAVATSGNYEQYLMINGKRHAHIIDPKTGFPTSGIKSTTVISPSAELSDALATALFVLGIETGMDLIDQLPHAECLIIDENDQIHFSKNLNYINNES